MCACLIILNVQSRTHKPQSEVGVMKMLDQLVLDGLEKLVGQKVYLTGSRFFGTETPQSDLDVFTKFSQKAQKNLTEMGFTVLPKPQSNYTDSLTAEVWRKVEKFSTNHIDVQLVTDIALKQRIQDSLLKSGAVILLSRLAKHERKLMWNFGRLMVQD
jgi:hypothetical protein